MILLSGAVIYAVHRSRSRVHHDETQARRDSRKQSIISSFRLKNIKNRMISRDTKFAITTVCINILFLALNLPLVILTLLTVNMDPDLLSILFYLFELFFYSYYAIGFYVQLTANSVFRNEFLAMLNLRRVGSEAIGGTLSKINSVADGSRID